MSRPRLAGLALVLYVALTFVAFVFSGTPGGDYDASALAAFVASGHAGGIAACLAGALGALALVPFARGLASEVGVAAVAPLGTAAASAGVVGWCMSAALPIAFLEAGAPVREALPLAVVQVLGESAVLVSLCAPALVIGVAALAVASRSAAPRWLRIASAVGGVAGVTAAAFLTFFVYLAWAVAVAVWLIRRGASIVPDLGAVAQARVR